MYDYDYGYSYGSALGGFVGALLIMYIIILLVGLAVSVLMIISQWKIFKKAGKNGWEAIIPFYNMWVLSEVGGFAGWWGLIAMGATLIPGIGQLVLLAYLIILNLNIAKKFGKETGFAVLLILVPVVGYPMLAFGKNVFYNASIPNVVNLPGNDANNNNNNQYAQNPYGQQAYGQQPYNQNNMGAPMAQPMAQPMDNANVQGGAQMNASAPQAQAAFCTTCGSPIAQGNAFCTTCGTPVNK